MRIIVPTDHDKSNSAERATIMRTRMQLEEETEWRRVPDPDTEEERTTQTSDTKNDFVSNENEIRSGKMEKRTGNSSLAADEGNKDEGYNSSEEHESKIMRTLTALRKGNTVINTFELFAEKLKSKKGFIIKKMAEDGNCLFRSIADQIYGDPEMHDQVRSRCMDYMYAEREHFSQFVTEDINSYIQRKRQNQCYGNNVEIQAIGELYNRPIEIYTLNDATQEIEQVNLFHQQYSTDNPPIRLSYHNRNHYNSVIDPNNPSVGVGLGLPQLQPGVCILSIHTLYPLYSHSISTLFKLYIHSIHTLYPLYSHSISSLFTLYIHSIHTLYPLYSNSIYTLCSLYTLYPLYSHSMYTLYPLYISSMYLCTFYTHSMYTLYPLYVHSTECIHS
jgi:hypothetical protein